MISVLVDHIITFINFIFWFICDCIFQGFRFIEIVPRILSVFLDCFKTLIAVNDAVFQYIFYTFKYASNELNEAVENVGTFFHVCGRAMSAFPSCLLNLLVKLLTNCSKNLEEMSTVVINHLSSIPENVSCLVDKSFEKCMSTLNNAKDIGILLKDTVLFSFGYLINFVIKIFHFCLHLGKVLTLTLADVSINFIIWVSVPLISWADHFWNLLISNLMYPLLETFVTFGESLARTSIWSLTRSMEYVCAKLTYIGKYCFNMFDTCISMLFVVLKTVSVFFKYGVDLCFLPFRIVCNVISNLELQEFCIGLLLMLLFLGFVIFLIFHWNQNHFPFTNIPHLMLLWISRTFDRLKFLTKANKEADADYIGKSNMNDQGDNLSCLVCQDLGRSVLLLPCRHLCLCPECYQRISETNRCPKCPVCRVRIDDHIDVFM